MLVAAAGVEHHAVVAAAQVLGGQAQAVRQAARGLLALFPAALPVLGMAGAGAGQAEADVSGFQLPMVQA